ncbi:MAG TPA: sigma-70 family RNA polymerase sigma factor [Mycobacteriales bacterium]|nr:sigma-70 family RNA polymerase sigma factor [Mycobacteriales bacterium]
MMTTETGGPPPRSRFADGAAADFLDWRAGDADALGRLVRRVTPTLWHVARAYGLSREAAEDVVQSSWVTLARAADTVREPQAIVSWLCVTTRREAARVVRRTRLEDSTEPAVLAEQGPPAADLADAVLADDEAAALWRRVDQLPPRCRQLLRIVAFEDRPDYRSISAELSMPVGSIGPTRRRCLDKLRELLADDTHRSDR